MKDADIIETAAERWSHEIDQQMTSQRWREFKLWFTADPRHRIAFLSAHAQWATVAHLNADRAFFGAVLAQSSPGSGRTPFTQPGRFSTAAGRVSANIRQVARGCIETLRLNQRRWQLASLLLALAAGPLLWSSAPKQAPDFYRTPVGIHQRILLADGSVIDLNTGSEVRVRLLPERRGITLVRGEALFHVAHDNHRPFVVTADDTSVRAVGTKFSVRLRDQHAVDVLVTEGRVLVGPLQQPDSATALPTAVPSGTFMQFKHGTPLSTQMLPVEAVDRRTAWIDGWLIFQGETLEEVVSEFNRYNERKLVIVDASIATLQIAGVIRTTNPDSLVDGLHYFFGIEGLPATGQDGHRVILLRSSTRAQIRSPEAHE